MAKGRNQHIVTHGKEWAVRSEGADRARRLFETKQEAVDYGRVLARKYESELVIHGRDGRIQNKDSHGHDPFPPRDRR